ncbi:MAG: amino acid decarboxylase [Ruminococcaceae bacterium]|nr:amino acid decarboxylase [Oscillospiraceae bacterium]
MNTPISDYIDLYCQKNALRLHMPGHKGNGPLGIEARDITEIPGADSLYEAGGIIQESEQNAAKLFGTKATFFSTEGSSLCIRGMLWLIKLYAAQNKKKAVIAACRNAHKTFVTASALLDIEVDYLPSALSESYLACTINASSLADYLNGCDTLPTAVYITSPDYLGNIADIATLSKVCHAHGVLLLVDNAHGAYLRFLYPSWHPMDLGADLCCDSAHKTLPVLTGGAYLHISQNAPDFFVTNAKNALSLFGSTSPSYLILQSLDLANRSLAKCYPKKLQSFVPKIQAVKEKLSRFGFTLLGNEPLKLTILTREYGYTGIEFAAILRKQGMECEFCDPDVVVLMLSPAIEEASLADLAKTICQIPPKAPLRPVLPTLFTPETAMAPKDAMLCASETVSLAQACGRILASANIACPPAVPIVIMGQRIDQNAIRLFQYYGITECCVVIE